MVLFVLWQTVLLDIRTYFFKTAIFVCENDQMTINIIKCGYKSGTCRKFITMLNLSYYLVIFMVYLTTVLTVK